MSVEIATTIDTFGESAAPEHIERTARLGERHGFDALLVGDHIAFPAETSDTYPFTPDGEAPAMYHADADCYDPFEVLSYVAGRTDRIRLGTNMCVAPIRHPVHLTKNVLTLDALAKGRVDFGVAIGWLQTEYEVLDVPFEERGARTDEFLEVFERACERAQFAFDGTYHSFQETGFRPRPAQPGGPPVWIGGTSSAALRRLGRYGDGIVAVWDRPDEVRALTDRMRRAWRDFDRDGEPRLAVMRPAAVDPAADSDKPLVGRADAVVADVERYADAGATRLVLDFYAENVDEKHRQIERFGEAVIPRL
jgi:probable F420-dependent oxidoreductase